MIQSMKNFWLNQDCLKNTVFKSGFLPKILGAVLMIHCCTWLMNPLQFFLSPGFTAIAYVSYPLGLIAEFGLSLWLLIVGAKEQQPA